MAGVIVRTDWEVITEASVANSFNLLNLFAAGALARNPEADLDEVYKAWCDYGLLSPLRSGSVPQTPVRPANPEAWKILKRFMQASWKVIEKSQYVRGHLFHEDDQYCNSVKRSFDMMVNIHGRDDWEPGASRLVEPTEENVALVLAEKREAVDEARRLGEILELEKLGLGEDFRRDCGIILRLFVLYVRGFELCAEAVFSAAKLPADKVGIEAAIEKLRLSTLKWKGNSRGLTTRITYTGSWTGNGSGN